MSADPAKHLIIASVSGGKDSGAMFLHLQEQGFRVRPVFQDTGWEHPVVYDYLDYLEGALGTPIARLRATIDLRPELEEIAQGFERRLGRYSSMVRLVLSKGMFPSRKKRFCTQMLKVFVSAAYIRSLDEDVINAVGLRAEESASRAALGSWEWSEAHDCWVWRPILEWTLDEVWAIHRRHGIKVNPLYGDGCSRVGCWPCIYARKAEIRHIADTDPTRIAILADLEATVTRLAKARAEARGEVLANPSAWFQSPLREASGSAQGHRWSCWPIAKVVRWSHTSRGGQQYELFAPSADESGCFRFGVCDTSDMWMDGRQPLRRLDVLTMKGERHGE